MASISHGSRGAIAAGDPRAAVAGMLAYGMGGNAIDAALSAAVTQWVVMPDMCGPGGDCLALVGKQGKVIALNASGPPPKSAFGHRNPLQISSTVPAALQGMEAVHRIGGELPLHAVFGHAVQLARQGFTVSGSLAWQFKNVEKTPFGKELASNITGPIRECELVSWPNMADTLESIAEKGSGAFGSGKLGETMLSEWSERGVSFQPDDLTDIGPEPTEPLAADYEGWHLWAQPPVSQGAIILLALEILGREGREELGEATERGIHLGIEAIKSAMEIGSQSIYDGSSDTLRSLIASGKLKKQRISPLASAGPSIMAGYGETTHVATADKDGWMVSLLHSLYLPFGAKVMSPSTGVILNNRGLCFDMEGPNSPEPGRRPRHTLSNLMMESPEGQRIALGTPGANAQVQTILQIALGLMTAPEREWSSVLDRPRWGFWGGKHVAVEDRVPRAVMAALSERGHSLVSRQSWDPLTGAVGVAIASSGVGTTAIQDRRREGISLAI